MNPKQAVTAPSELEVDDGWPELVSENENDKPTLRQIILPELMHENEQTPTEQYPLPERTVLMMLFGRKEDWK